MRDGGKGDLKRPLVVSEETFNNNWDAIFGAAKKLSQNMDQVNAVFNKTYEEWSKDNLEPIPFAGMVNTDEV